MAAAATFRAISESANVDPPTRLHYADTVSAVWHSYDSSCNSRAPAGVPNNRRLLQMLPLQGEFLPRPERYSKCKALNESSASIAAAHIWKVDGYTAAGECITATHLQLVRLCSRV